MALLVLGLMLFFTSCQLQQNSAHQTPGAVKGVLDLSGIDINQTGPVSLDGEWEFYPGSIITPGGFRARKVPPARYIRVPSSWNGYPLDDSNRMTGTAAATYRLVVSNINVRSIGLRLDYFHSSYLLFVNGNPAASNGLVHPDPVLSTAQYIPQVVFLDTPGESLELVVQAANNLHYRGGFVRPVLLGTQEQVRRLREQWMSFDIISIAVLAVIILYNLSAYMMRRKDRTLLYLGLVCLDIMLRTIFTGEILILNIFPAFDPELECRFEVITFVLSIPLFSLYMRSFLPGSVPGWFMKAVLGMGTLFTLVFALLPYRLSYLVLPVYQVWAILSCITVVVLLALAVKKRESGSPAFLFSFLLTMTAMVNDILYSQGLIKTLYIAPAGLLGYAVFQALVMNVRNARAYHREELLAQKLSVNNRMLEESNVKLRELDKLKSDFLSTVSHELRTPMTPIIGFLSIMKSEIDEKCAADGVKSGGAVRETALKMSSYVDIVARNADHLMEMLERILSLTEIEAGRAFWYNDRFSVKELLALFHEKHLIRYEEAMKEKEQSLDIETNDVNAVLKGDKRRLAEVLDNLVSNAVKFTSRGTIVLRAEREGNMVRFSVTDQGPGIPEKLASVIFDKFRQLGDVLTDKPEGIGIGLTLCTLIVEHHGGTIGHNNVPGGGSCFWFALPAVSDKEDGLL